MLFFFFFQAEDGIRDHCVTGVQTCALPISLAQADVDPQGVAAIESYSADGEGGRVVRAWRPAGATVPALPNAAMRGACQYVRRAAGIDRDRRDSAGDVNPARAIRLPVRDGPRSKRPPLGSCRRRWAELVGRFDVYARDFLGVYRAALLDCLGGGRRLV